MAGRARILIVEDEPQLRAVLRLYLEREGHMVVEVGDGAAALAAFEESGADLVILDLMLPGMQGEVVLEELRDRGVPILITSAKRSDGERIAGLRAGADDYLGKPFNPRELTARVAAILRRTAPARVEAGAGLSLDHGRLTIDWATRRFSYRDGPGGQLTPAEAALLAALARRPGMIMSRAHLVEVVARRPDEVYERIVDVHVGNLRQKLSDDAADPWLIETIAGAGYRLIAEVDRA